MNKLKSIFHRNKKTTHRRTTNNNNNNTALDDNNNVSIEQSEKSSTNSINISKEETNKMNIYDKDTPAREKLEQLTLNDNDMTLEDRYNELFNNEDEYITRDENTGSSFDESVVSPSSIDSVSSPSISASSSLSLSLSNNGGNHIPLDDEEDINLQTFIEQQELKEYKLLSKIGEGAFSKVFKSVKLSTGENVAIKVIKKETLSKLNTDPTRRKGSTEEESKSKLEQVLKEVALHKMVTSLQCENIVKFIEFKESRSFYYIVQELLTGGEIFNSIVKYTYFSEDLSRHVIRQLGNAIKALHSVGVVHRDIKPENLLFEPIEYIPRDQPRLRRSDDPLTKMDEGEFCPGIGGGGIGVVKLTDFGLSKQIYQTNTKTPCGTVGYTAPEVVKDERYSMKVDMWGVGCVLYTMLCGFPPFYDDRIDVLTEKISKGEYTFLEPWWDEISDGAKNCVSRLLEVDPDRRYNIDEFLNDPWLNRYDTRNSGKGTRKKGKIMHEQIKQARIFQEDPSILYSPAAVAMRDAFDISNAVKRRRDGIVVGMNNKRKGLYVLDEESEIRNEDGYTDNNNNNNNTFKNTNVFELNLNTSTIIQRRQKKQRMAISNRNRNNNVPER